MKLFFNILLPILFWGFVGSHAVNADSASARLEAFEKLAGIQTWPRVDRCRYTELFTDKIAGVIIKVYSEKHAYSRWDTRCHVPIIHDMIDWPRDLPNGIYVVAVKSVEKEEFPDYKNRVIRIISVLGRKPNQDPLISAAIDKICAKPIEQKETYNDCRKKNSW